MVAHEHGACAAGADARCDPIRILPSAARFLLTGTCLTSALMMQAKADTPATRDRNGSLVAIEAYAPNIVRITISLDRALADAPPGEDPDTRSDATGWAHRTDRDAAPAGGGTLGLDEGQVRSLWRRPALRAFLPGYASIRRPRRFVMRNLPSAVSWTCERRPSRASRMRSTRSASCNIVR